MEDGLKGLSHLFVTVFLAGFAGFMVIPAITDVTMAALCPGQDECSLAIYLSGFQQAIIGIGAVVMTPLVGNLSDKYGRKTLLTLPITLSILPLVILAYSRDTYFFYTYYVARTVTAMVGESSILSLALAYVADYISPARRASAFGILSGVGSAAFVSGTLAARFLSTASTFQVAALVSMTATVYMRIFLKESIPNGNVHDDDDDQLSQPILKEAQLDHNNEKDESHEDQLQKSTNAFRKPRSLGDVIFLFSRSVTLSQAAIVMFFYDLAGGGVQASLLYFLKAQYHFNKNQFADLLLITGSVGAVSQLILMPLLAPAVREEKLLSIGLLVGSGNMFINSISWSVWVPYVLTATSVFSIFVQPSIRSIVSKQVGPNEQGKAQGCISGISSLANIVAPFIFSPLTALFLSKDAPFHYPGFSIMCIALATMFAFIQSLRMRAVPPISSPEKANSNNSLEEA